MNDAPPDRVTRAVRLRVAGGLVALGAGAAALIVVILLVRATLA